MDCDRDAPRISEFFRDREVFITGGTGSVGKALIEKILFSCPDVKKIYLLMRPKKKLDIHERLAKFSSGIIFNRVRAKDCSLLKKLIPINGDSKEIGLGLRNEDKKLMENVSVIFHGAASVRFDDPLKDAILLNTRGTWEVIKFAETLKKLCVFVHISTTYCYPYLLNIEEKLYPMSANWRESIRIAENVDRETLDIIGPLYMKSYPNSYCFSKGLSEQIFKEYKDKLPVVIFRPSIVTPSLREPYPGWLDFINGPIAFTLPGSLGINHVGLFKLETQCDYIPLDIVVKSLIVTAYVHGLSYERHNQLPELEIYNCAAGAKKRMSIRSLLEHSMEVVNYFPVDQAVWSARTLTTESLFLFKFIGIFVQFLPGLIFDQIGKIFKVKQKLLPILRTICYTTCKLQFFMFNTWNFDNTNFFTLMKHIKDADRDDFYYDYYSEYSSKKYIYLCGAGSRRFLLKQSDETLDYARRKHIVIKIVDKIVVSLFYFLIYYFFIHAYVKKFYLYWTE